MRKRVAKVKQDQSYLPIIWFIVVFGGLGLVMLTISYSASSRTVLEAEDTALTGAVTVQSDSSASGNAAIEFLEEGTVPQTLNCLPRPSACGYPDETNTGIQSGVTLTPSGSITVDTDGAIIENLDITGTIKIEADNVTVRNTRITSPGSSRYTVNLNDNVKNLQFEDCEIIVGNVLGNKVIAPRSGVDYSFRRCDLSGGEDLIHPSSNGVIEDNYFHNLQYVPTGHNDTVQVLGGANTVVRHNTMLVYDGPIDGFPDTGRTFNAALMIGNLRGNFSNFEFSDNLINGGNFTINANWGSVDDGQFSASNIRIINNRIGCDFRFGPIASDTADYATVSGNVWDKNGRSVDGGTNADQRRALCNAAP